MLFSDIIIVIIIVIVISNIKWLFLKKNQLLPSTANVSLLHYG